jgi:hypothetical protein
VFKDIQESVVWALFAGAGSDCEQVNIMVAQHRACCGAERQEEL